MRGPASIQEMEYAFPYHFIPQYVDGTYSQIQNLSWGLAYIHALRRLTSLLQDLNFRSLVDVGCGDGRLVFELRRVLPHVRLTGIDFAEPPLRFARAYSPEVEFVCADVSKCSLTEDRKFEMATLIEVLEHIPPLECPAFLQGVHDLLIPEGKLVLSVPTLRVPTLPKHYRHFSLELLGETLGRLFRIDQVIYLNRITLPRRLLDKILGNRFFCLTERHAMTFLYEWYGRQLLEASPRDAGQILAVCSKND